MTRIIFIFPIEARYPPRGIITSLGIGGIKFSKNVANKRPGYHTVYIRSTNQAPIAVKDIAKY